MADLLPDKKDTPAKKVLPFASTIEDLKTKVAQLTKAKKMGADLLFMVTYMASPGLANATRPEILTFAANRKECISAIYIEKVDTFAKKWGFSYSESLSIVAERVNNTNLRSMLNRYANAIESGVPDEDFLENELSSVRTVYRSPVEQGLDMLKKWGDTDIAMLLSGTVISVVMMISIAIFFPFHVVGFEWKKEKMVDILAHLITHIRQSKAQLVVIDSLTLFTEYAETDAILTFFTSCKSLVDHGKKILVTFHTYALEEDILVRIRSISDAHLNMKKALVGDKYVKEVIKVRGAGKTPGNLVSFEVHPGYGMKIIPMSFARV